MRQGTACAFWPIHGRLAGFCLRCRGTLGIGIRSHPGLIRASSLYRTEPCAEGRACGLLPTADALTSSVRLGQAEVEVLARAFAVLAPSSGDRETWLGRSSEVGNGGLERHRPVARRFGPQSRASGGWAPEPIADFMGSRQTDSTPLSIRTPRPPTEPLSATQCGIAR